MSTTSIPSLSGAFQTVNLLSREAKQGNPELDTAMHTLGTSVQQTQKTASEVAKTLAEMMRDQNIFPEDYAINAAKISDNERFKRIGAWGEATKIKGQIKNLVQPIIDKLRELVA